MRLTVVLRIVSLSAMIACVLAVIVARSAPRAAAFRLQCDPRRAALCGPFPSAATLGLRVVDTATGQVSSLPAPSDGVVHWASFSDWLDDDGEWQVVGRCASFLGSGLNRVSSGTGLVRLTYPSGRILDRVSDSALPACAPCWYPGPFPRVLYAAADGRLYQCAFGRAGSGGSLPPPEVRPVRWATSPASPGEPLVSQVVWPKGLGGFLVAAVKWRGETGRCGPQRLWWLRLSPDGSAVADTGLLPADGLDGDASVDYGTPGAAPLPGGGHVIAYLRRRNKAPEGELCVAPLRFDEGSARPAVGAAEARELAQGIVPSSPAFSPDGAWVYAVKCGPGGQGEVRRFAVNGDSRAQDRDRSAERRGVVPRVPGDHGPAVP